MKSIVFFFYLLLLLSTKTVFGQQFAKLPGGVQLEFVEQGDPKGTVVLFLHGFTDSWYSFETTLKHMPANIHAIAISQRGHGNSTKPEGAYDPKEFAADIAAFIKLKKLKPAFIVGHSLGGIIAQQFALDYPQLVRGLILVSTDASFKDNPGMPEFQQQIMGLTDPISREFADAFQQSTIVQPIDTAYYQVLVKESMKVPQHVWKGVINELMKVDLTPALGGINHSTLIFWGDKDSFCRKIDQDILIKEIKNSRLITYKENGHALHWEQPQRFATDLTAFISANMITK
jgi:pimeloyl-ACP methyl ester carboxylesterase